MPRRPISCLLILLAIRKLFTGATNEPKVPVAKGNAADTVAGTTTGVVPGKTALLPAGDATTLFSGSSTGGADPSDSVTMSKVVNGDTLVAASVHGKPT